MPMRRAAKLSTTKISCLNRRLHELKYPCLLLVRSILQNQKPHAVAREAFPFRTGQQNPSIQDAVLPIVNRFPRITVDSSNYKAAVWRIEYAPSLLPRKARSIEEPSSLAQQSRSILSEKKPDGISPCCVSFGTLKKVASGCMISLLPILRPASSEGRGGCGARVLSYS